MLLWNLGHCQLITCGTCIDFIHDFNHVENVFTGLSASLCKVHPVIQVPTGPLQHVLFNQSVLDFVPSMASLSCCMTWLTFHFGILWYTEKFMVNTSLQSAQVLWLHNKNKLLPINHSAWQFMCCVWFSPIVALCTIAQYHSLILCVQNTFLQISCGSDTIFQP